MVRFHDKDLLMVNPSSEIGLNRVFESFWRVNFFQKIRYFSIFSALYFPFGSFKRGVGGMGGALMNNFRIVSFLSD